MEAFLDNFKKAGAIYAPALSHRTLNASEGSISEVEIAEL